MGKFIFEPTVAPTIAPIYGSHARNIVLRGGRGGSKSRAVGDWCLARSFMSKIRVLNTREYQNSIADSSKTVLEASISHYKLDSYFIITKDKIYNKITGSDFIFCGLQKPDRIKSYEGIDIMWCEEAHSISMRSMKFLVPTIRKPGSQLVWTYNPEFENDPVHKRFTGDNIRPDDLIINVNYSDNPWFYNTALVDEMEWDKQHDYNNYLHIWEGQCIISTEKQIFDGVWSTGEIPEPPANTIFYHGADWGFSNDPTAVIRCWFSQDRRTIYVDRAVGGVGIEVVQTPDVLRKIDTIATGQQVIADSARPEIISHCSNAGINIRSAAKGAGSIEDGISFLRSHKIIVAEELREVAKEFATYSYKTDKHSGDISRVPEDSNNHYIDALRYALEPVRKNKTMQSGNIVGFF